MVSYETYYFCLVHHNILMGFIIRNFIHHCLMTWPVNQAAITAY